MTNIKKIIKSLSREPRLPKDKQVKRIVRDKLIDNNNTNFNCLINIPITSKKHFQYDTPDWFTKKDKAEVSVIVPLYKSNLVIKDLINSWDFINANINVEIIFVDDNCPNDSKLHLMNYFNELENVVRNPIGRVFYNEFNQGFGPTCNTGAFNATGDYLIFLNADTVVTKNWIAPMIDLFKDPDVGIVGNLQIKQGGTWDGYIDSAGSEWNWDNKNFNHIGRHSYNLKEIPSPFHINECPPNIIDSVKEVEMVTGCCFAIKKRTI